MQWEERKARYGQDLHQEQLLRRLWYEITLGNFSTHLERIRDEVLGFGSDPRPIVQLDRMPGYGPGGRGFESCSA